MKHMKKEEGKIVSDKNSFLNVHDLYHDEESFVIIEYQ